MALGSQLRAAGLPGEEDCYAGLTSGAGLSRPVGLWRVLGEATHPLGETLRRRRAVASRTHLFKNNLREKLPTKRSQKQAQKGPSSATQWASGSVEREVWGGWGGGFSNRGRPFS